MMKENKKKLAYCGFDGTLAKDYISTRFMDRLLEKGIYSEEAYEKQMNIYEKYKKGKMDYGKWITDWALLLAEGLKGKEAEKVDKAAKEEVKKKDRELKKNKRDVCVAKRNDFQPEIDGCAGEYAYYYVFDDHTPDEIKERYEELKDRLIVKYVDALSGRNSNSPESE